MKTPKLTFDQSDDFVLGIAISLYEIQFGLIAWIVTVKFKQ